MVQQTPKSMRGERQERAYAVRKAAEWRSSMGFLARKTVLNGTLPVGIVATPLSTVSGLRFWTELQSNITIGIVIYQFKSAWEGSRNNGSHKCTFM